MYARSRQEGGGKMHGMRMSMQKTSKTHVQRRERRDL